MSTSPSILVVDDEADLREMLIEYLQGCGFRAEGAADGIELDQRLAAHRPDLVLLDVNMPGENGFAILQRLRRTDTALPIIMATAAGASAQRVDGLTGGADDYVVKPLELRELVARIRAVLDRVARAGPPVQAASPLLLPFGPHRVDLGGRRLLGPDGAEIELTAMEFDLVAVLAQHPNRVISRDRLSELAHNRPPDPGDRSIDIRITRLRKKLEPDPTNPRLIRTVRGEGYVYEG